MNHLIPIIIPAYEPDDKLIGLIEDIIKKLDQPIIVIDDGSGQAYAQIFDRAQTYDQVEVLHHAVNCGKGRALKTAFNVAICRYPDMLGVVTIDSDGQHTCQDMKRCMEALEEHPQDLILGVRDFSGSNVPGRSSFGNVLTSKVLKVLTGINTSDTQTGLRVIPIEFVKNLIVVDGERFEFETNMLLETREQGIAITEVPIETIYLESNRASHFHPLKDSFRIYVVFFKFLLASGSSSLIDLVLFSVFCGMLRGKSFGRFDYIFVATVMARVISAIYNFTINYRVVFKSNSAKLWAALKYFALAVVIMVLSGSGVSFMHGLVNAPETLIKIPVDCILFLLSFWVQREFVYRKR